MKKILLIVNPTSGMKRSQKKLLDITKVFCDADMLVTTYTTKRRFDATEFVAAHGRDYDIICAIGGDGTLNEVITGASKIDYHGEYGFIPSGTTNDLANSLGIPKEPAEAARLIAEGEAKFTDIANFGSNRKFTYIASFGAFTETSYSVDQKAKNIFGHLAYVADGINSLSQIKSYEMTVCIDDKEYRGEFIFGAAANALSVGGIMKLEKDKVDFDDGMHEVLLVRKPKNAVQFAQIFTSAINGSYDDSNILFLHGSKITFKAKEKVDWCIDGEFAGSVNVAEIENIHGKLKVIRP